MEKLGTTHKIIVGRFGAPHGLQGWIKVNSYTQPKDNILNYQPWLIDVNGKQQTVKIAAHNGHGKTIAIQIEGCRDRDAAADYTNATISILREQLPTLAENEYYWADLKGLAVINHDNIQLGIIDYIMSTGSNDVLVIKGDKDYLIPYLTDEVVLKIDLQNGVMNVRWDVEGLDEN